MAVTYQKECVICGTPFTSTRSYAKYCGKKCNSKAHKEYAKKGLPRSPVKTCKYCNQEFRGANYRYCPPCHRRITATMGSVEGIFGLELGDDFGELKRKLGLNKDGHQMNR